MNKKSILWLMYVASGCMGARVNTAPVPELPPTDVWMRGTEGQAARLSNADEAEIVANVVRGFYRPLAGHARLIAPKPLANERSRWADSVIAPDVDRLEALVRVIGLRNVCGVGSAAPECTGNRPIGVLRFSPAYVVAKDTALIYAQYWQQRGGIEGEIQFTMVRTAEGWHMASRRSLQPMQAQNDGARAIADQLLAADRAFGQQAAGKNVVEALSAMFDDGVIVQIPGGFSDGKANAIASLRATPANEQSRITWAPIRVGVSADGLHGFSYGYMTMVRPDSVRVPLKYLAYWVNRDGQWRVLAYKRRPRPEGQVSLELLPPALPAAVQLLRPTAYSLPAIGENLAAAEKEFSDTAQVIGIGPAFERYGRTDAMNMGGPNDTAFVIGNRNVGRSIGAGYPATGSPVHWASDYRTIVASSGDLGVTFGYIRPHQAPPAGQPQFFPFFTIWKRDPGGPWRYIAE